MGGGGVTGGTRSSDPGPPPLVWRSIYKKKFLHDPGPNPHTAAAIRKEVLTPPKKRRTQVGGGGGRGVKIKNFNDFFKSRIF